MTLTARDEDELRRALAIGHMEKSPSGPTWERWWTFAVEQSAVVPAEVTANITAEVRVPAKNEPPLDDQELVGRVRSKLMRIPNKYRTVLEAYYGDRGALCAGQGKHGQLAAIFPYTAAGRDLSEDLHPQEERAARETRASMQALELKSRAEELYTAASERWEAERRARKKTT